MNTPSEKMTQARLLKFLATQTVTSQEDYEDLMVAVAMWAKSSKRVRSRRSTRQPVQNPAKRFTLEEVDHIIDREAKIVKARVKVQVPEVPEQLDRLALIDKQSKVAHDAYTEYRCLMDLKKWFHIAAADPKEVKYV